MNALEQLNLAVPIANTYSEVENTLLCHIAEQLAANPDTLINATSEWRIKMLAQMGRLNKDTAKIIAAKVGKVPSEVEKVVNTAIDTVLAENGITPAKNVTADIKSALKSYDRQAVKSKYNQVNTVMQYKAKKAYADGVNSVADCFTRMQQKALDNAQDYLNDLNANAMAVVMGEKSRTEALRETISKMCDKGIPAFIDAAGKEWSPEAYVNMDIRNTAKNSALAAQWTAMDELGQDVILVSSHSGARPLCAKYQGKLYSRSGKSGTITDARGKEYKYEPLSSTSFGEAAGLFGINCGHRMRGVSNGTFINREKQYDETENGEEYEKVCEQRKLERKIRADKTKQDALRAAGDTEGAKALNGKIAAENKQLKAYCEKNELSYRADRTEVYGYSNPAKKSVTNDFVETIKLPDSSNAQAYKPVIIDENRVETLHKGGKDITVRKVTSADNNIFVSDGVKLKPKQLHNIDKNISEAIDKLTISSSKSLPQICIISNSDMQSLGLAAYNPVTNVMYIDENAGIKANLLALQKQLACPDNETSTFVHELIHWSDAEKYRARYGTISDYGEYIRSLNDKCKKELDKLVANGYNINDISDYARKCYDKSMYSETYTEYRVNIILKG